VSVVIESAKGCFHRGDSAGRLLLSKYLRANCLDMEHDISGFPDEYEVYFQTTRRHGVDISLYENLRNHSQAYRESMEHDFKNLDVKMRLAFGIQEIWLNNRFVDDKQGELKRCHYLYYKLADLWFAYEAYLKFLGSVLHKDIKKNIEWVAEGVHTNFAQLRWVEQAVRDANATLAREFRAAGRRQDLEVYLRYCESHAKGNQGTRLGRIIPHLMNGGVLSLVDFLTLCYAVRNNFVHGGETTVVPNNFSFENKARLLGVLYPFLAISLLSWVNEAARRI
jgi:hypothetical protein